MGPLRKFWGLSARDQIFLIKTICLLGMIRLGLCLLPFRTMRRLLKRIAHPVGKRPTCGPRTVDSVTWAVHVASQYIPKATCLTQAMATQVLLLRGHHPADFRIGVSKGKSGQLEAHAWVESGGRIVIGGADSALRFTPLPSLDEQDSKFKRL